MFNSDCIDFCTLVDALHCGAYSYSDAEGGYIPVRLRLFGEQWELLWGDPQYDTDHRGDWAHADLPLGATRSTCRTTASDLLNQLDDQL